MKALFGILLMIWPVFWSTPQVEGGPVESLRELGQTAFKPGEVLRYKIRYGLINAGEAELHVSEITERANRPVYHVIGTGRTVGMAEWFFKTRDRYESFIDTQAMVPWEFIRDVNEGGYEINRHLLFDHYKQNVIDLEAPGKGSISFDAYAQDMISAFYYARTYDASILKQGDEIDFNMFLDHEPFPFKLVILGRKWIDTDMGKVRCLELRPKLQEGRIFKESEDMTIYVSDDQNKIPILIKSDLLVGSVKVELSGYESLRAPIQFQ